MICFHLRFLRTLVGSIFLIWFILFTAAPSCFAQNANGNGNAERFVSIDFNDVDINVFIKFISELTETNFIVDRRVKGKVTIISPSKISVNEAYRVFESVLEVHGFTTVESGEVTKIVPAPDARTKSIRTLIRQEHAPVSPDDKVVTQIIPLRYAESNDIKRLFAPLISRSSVILAYEPTNMLIVTDVYSNIQRLLHILKTIDVVGIGQEISVIPLLNGDATKMVRVLSSIFQAQRAAKKGAPAPITEPVKFVADERTNSIVLLASEVDTMNIKRLIQQLDLELPPGKEKIHVYYLEHATAEELAQTLQSLATGRTAKPAEGKAESPVVSENVKITADKPTNSLIIMAEKDEYTVVESIIKQLDIPRAMVYIEALIMEVDVTKQFSLGTEWIGGGKVEYGSDKDAWLGSGWSGPGDTGFSNIAGVAGAATAGGPVLLPPGFSLGVFGEFIEIAGVKFPNLSAVIQVFRRNRFAHILSTPQLLTTDNEEASLSVGRNIPYQTKTGTTATSETYNTYEYRDVGIALKVTPQISKDRLIRLTLEQEVSSIVSGTQIDERPTTQKRTVNTTVIVNDGNTIVIGGLIEDQFNDSTNKIPCLGDIPGLGWAFKSMGRDRRKTNLYVFLTPHVLKSHEEATELYESKKEQLDKIEEQEGIKLYQRYFDQSDSTYTIPDFIE